MNSFFYRETKGMDYYKKKKTICTWLACLRFNHKILLYIVPWLIFEVRLPIFGFPFIFTRQVSTVNRQLCMWNYWKKENCNMVFTEVHTQIIIYFHTILIYFLFANDLHFLPNSYFIIGQLKLNMVKQVRMW